MKLGSFIESIHSSAMGLRGDAKSTAVSTAPRRASKRAGPTRILLLETDLDHELTSQRTQIPFIRSFVDQFPDIELIAKQVHTRADLVKFLDMARLDPQVKMLHIIAHGSVGETASSIVLTGGEHVDLRARPNQRLFAELHTDAIMLSCCLVGTDHTLMHRILETSGAAALFSYARELDDWQAFLIEMLLYHLSFGNQPGRRVLAWREIYERLKHAIASLRIDPSADALADPLLVADFARKG
jgi:hypothetical protein